MNFDPRKLAFSRSLRSLAVALALLLVSGGVWQGHALYDFAVCISSLAPSGPAKSMAATMAGTAATPAPRAPMAEGVMTSDMHAPTIFTLKTGVAEGRMVYLGVGGDINGAVNPKLVVHEGETVQINLINGEGAEHDIVVDQYGVRSSRVVGKGASSAVDVHRVQDRRIRLLLLGRRPSRGGHGRAHSSRARATRRLGGDGGRHHAATPPTCPRRSASARRKSCASI